MQYEHYCFKYSLVLLKVNFFFIILFQVIKFVINNETTKMCTNYNVINGNNNPKTTILSSPVASFDSPLSSLFKASSVSSSVDASKIGDQATVENAFKSIINNFIVSVYPSYSYDINTLEATRIDDVKILNISDANNVFRPIMIETSYINFTELLHFNNLKTVLKVAFIYNLNLSCILINMIMISYELIKRRESKKSSMYYNDHLSSQEKKKKRQISKKFLKLNLAMNNMILLIILLCNLFYLAKSSSFFKHYVSIFENNFYMNLFKTNNDSVSYLKYKSNSYKINFDYLELAFLRFNVIIMIISLTLLAFYTFLLKNDEYDSLCCIITSKSESSSDLNSSEMLKYECIEHNSSNLSFVRLKMQKLEKKVNVDIQWLVHFLLVIYLLSIWDISDVYRNLRAPDLNKNNMKNLLLQKHSNFPSFDLNQQWLGNKESLMINNPDFSSDDEKTKFKLSSLNEYFKIYEDESSKNFIHEKYQNKYQNLNGNGQVNEHMRKIWKIKGFFMLKIHSQVICDIAIVLFGLLILFKISSSIESYIDYFFFPSHFADKSVKILVRFDNSDLMQDIKKPLIHHI